ncbi:unnamed protein product [Ambrosiozyma monospora]|uniref:Unnamed protein product n=1 Tax=Ambrosiozyma monospora TaxID=43982 RepID=A0A9W6YQM0_AMBMO|nr:unnamed protein product [Ambrosiozyma monospora]
MLQHWFWKLAISQQSQLSSHFTYQTMSFTKSFLSAARDAINVVVHLPLSRDFLSAAFGSKNIVIFYNLNYVGFRHTSIVISNVNNSLKDPSIDGNDNNNKVPNGNNNNDNLDFLMGVVYNVKNYFADDKLFAGYGETNVEYYNFRRYATYDPLEAII